MTVEVAHKYLLGEFELEPDKHLLKREGEGVHLPELPFQVLLYLIENRERYVSRRELLDRFWSASDGYEETLTKCMSTIRTQLNDPPSAPRFIETRKKVGYRYIGPFAEAPLRLEPSVFAVEKTRAAKLVIEENDDDDHVSEKAIFPPTPASTLVLPTSKRSSRTVLSVFTLGVVALAIIASLIYRHRTQPNSTSTSIRSIAVLPLKNLSGDVANEYIADGLTDSLITTLSGIDDLRVVSRGSVSRYKDKEADPREVGQLLGVGAVLEGNVRRNGDSLRVALRLVSTDDGRVLWSNETDDRKIQDIFGLQDVIARNVVAQLRVKLGGQEYQKTLGRDTQNSEAYLLYLKGRYHLDKRRSSEAQKSLEYFQQAIQIDPNYALAYAGLAESYSSLHFLGRFSPQEVMPKAKAAAVRAVELDDLLSEAHTSLAAIKELYDWDWTGSEKEFKRALELNPNSSLAHRAYAFRLMEERRFDEALTQINRALELDPLSVVINRDVAQILYYERRYDQAIDQSQKTLELDPNFATTYGWLTLAYEQKGLFNEAFRTDLKRRTVAGEPPEKIAELEEIYARSGWRGYLEKKLEGLKEAAKQRYVNASDFASIYASLGDKDQAFAWLEKACQERDFGMVYLKVDPNLDSLHSDPRFADLERRVGLSP